MNTFRQIVYLVLDELKLTSDDAKFNEQHVMYLMNKYRAFLLKQRYADIKKQIPESNFQTISLTMEEVPAMSGIPYESGYFAKSTEKIPNVMRIYSPRVYSDHYYNDQICYVTRDRMRFTDYNKFISKIIYTSIAPDNYLYIKYFTENLPVASVKMTAIFFDAELPYQDTFCNPEDIKMDTMDYEFPLEDALIPPLIELICKELGSTIYNPEDKQNDSNDGLSETVVKK